MSAEENNASGGCPVRMAFNSSNVAEQWRVFKRQINYYFDSKYTVGQLTERRKVGVLMTALGRDGVEILDTFFKPTEQPSYDDIVKKFDEYCSPKKNTVFQRSVYFRLVQKPEQSIDMFLVELKRQAALCEFEATELEKLLRDILVIGLRDDKLREELLRDPDLDLTKAAAACRARERSQREASQIASSETPVVTVDAVQQHQRRPFLRAPPPSTSTSLSCPNCSYSHGTVRPCPAIAAQCKRCGKTGHFIKVCRSPAPARAVRAVEAPPEAAAPEQQVDLLRIYGCRVNKPNTVATDTAWYVDLQLGVSTCRFKLDTAAECNTIAQRSYSALQPCPKMLPSSHVIKPYNAPAFRPLGKIVVVTQSRQLEFLVMPNGEENLLGFQACRDLGLIQRVSRVNICLTKEVFVATNRNAFQGVGKIPGQNKIYVDPQATPIVVRWRRFAYSLLPKLKETLLEMLQQDIIAAVKEPTPWVSNITVVEKADGTLRICLDPHHLNKAIRVPKFVIPKPDDILCQLTKKKLFTVIDLKSGFWHMQLDDESSLLTTFNSPLGRFRFKRLCFGINCAPEMFMAEMVRIFGDITNVFPYFDDLIIATENEHEHDITLNLVCQRANEYNIKFNLEKLQFKKSSVQFLGLIIAETGVKPAPKHIRALVNMPAPADKAAVLRFLGLIKFLARFIPNVSQRTVNLRQLTQSDAEFVWTPAHDSEFESLKQIIVSQPILVFFDPKKQIVIQTDASKDGLGSVLLQDDKPVAFASRALTKTETKYSQIEKELLAIVFAAEKFHEYIYGFEVVVHSDHRPLETILRKELDKVSPRLQRLRLRLLRYKLSVVYKPGKQMLVADALSRAYLQDEKPNLEYQEVTVHSVKSLAVSEEKAKLIAQETAADPVLSLIKAYVETDQWPENVRHMPPQTARFAPLRADLTVREDLLFYENRLVVPMALRQFMLERLHEGHLGTEKTKRAARETVYWPSMTADITAYVAACPTCQKFARNNTRQSLHSLPIPTYPWQQLATDIATFSGKDYLIVVDKFSNWPEICPLNTKAASEVIAHLKTLFARFGIPESILSDNNPFNSTEYATFATEWGFTAHFSSPHYPQANGHAERTVQTVKMLLRKSADEGSSFQYALLQYRNTPLADTGFSPAQILCGRRLRTKLPVAPQLLRPATVPIETVVESKEKSQEAQQRHYNRASAELPDLQPNQAVWLKDKESDRQWQPATITQPGPGPRSFLVQKEEGKGSVIRNRRFLRPRQNLRLPSRYRE